jgi:hypothetical protein
MLVKCPT